MKTIGKILFSTIVLLVCAVSTAIADEPQVRNIIFLIGDGMGISHVSTAAVEQNYKPLNLERAQYIGLAKTYSASSRITDSAASGTAISSGYKTYNGAIGMNPDKTAVLSTREKAEQAGFATGVIATYSVTDATPAAFVAHVEDRNMQEEIAAQYALCNVDVVMGGGSKYFNQRKDKRNLIQSLIRKGYKVGYKLSDLDNTHSGKVVMLGAPKDLPTMLDGRGDYLPKATAKALEILTANAAKSGKGFFLMVEGSMIDGFGHRNNAEGMVAELLDFDAAVKVAFDYADAHDDTLVVVTADHETGGLTIISGDEAMHPQYHFSTDGHSGAFVPIYAYGAGAEQFSRVMENYEIALIMQRMLGLE